MRLQPGHQVWLQSTNGGYPQPGEIKEINERTGVYKILVTIGENESRLVEVTDSARLSARSNDSFECANWLQMPYPCDSAVLHTLRSSITKNENLIRVANCSLFVNSQRPIDEKNQQEVTSLAKSVYHRMVTTQKEQSIILKGECGSGKTDMFKALTSQIILASPKPPIEAGRRTMVSNENLMAALRVFESFGNARMPRNNNASRIGLHMQLFYKRGYIWSATFKQYAFDIDRVVNQAAGERSYHAFYEMLSGLKTDVKQRFGLLKANNYFVLSQGKCHDVPGRSDQDEFMKLQSSLSQLNFSADQQHTIWRVLSAILHLGNVYFKPTKDDNGVVLGSQSELQWVAYLLQLDAEAITKLLIHDVETHTSNVEVGEETDSTPSWTIDNALDMRDLLAKSLYSHLFDWIVERVNHAFFKSERQQCIHILDLPGFERYQSNGIEQFAINLAAERLHEFYMQMTFNDPQALYEKQKLDWEDKLGAAHDNKKVLEMITKRPNGILAILDNECKFPRGCDVSFLQKVFLNHANKSSFGKPRNKEKAEFCIKHFAGPAWYSASSFVTKNKDIIPSDMFDLMSASQNLVGDFTIAHMFRAGRAQTKSVRSKGYLLTSINESMSALFEKLIETSCWFVMCFRQNQEKSPDKIDMSLLFSQISAIGIGELLRILQTGYVINHDFHNFVRMYRCVLPPHVCKDKPDKETAYLILSQQGHRFSDEFQIGLTKVFIRERLSEHLLHVGRASAAKAAIIVQKSYRGYRVRKQYKRKQRAAVTLQAHLRGMNARTRYGLMKEKMLKEAETQAKNTKTMQKLQASEPTPTNRPQPPIFEHDMLDVPESMHTMLKKAAYSRLSFDDVLARRVDGAALHPNKHTLPADIHEYSFEKFAEDNFKGHVFNCRREPIVSPFLAKDSEAEFDLSVSMFKLVLKYLRDRETSAWCEILLANYIIQMAMKSPQVGDELYAQLINQTRGNTNTTACDKAWCLIALLASSVVPSTKLINFVINYVSTNAGGYRALVIGRLLQAQSLTSPTERRSLPPCWLEHGSCRTKQRMAVPAYSYQDTMNSYQIESWCTAQELAARILKDESIPRSGGWTVQLENDDIRIGMMPDTFVFDAIAQVELPDEFSVSSSSDWVVSPKHGAVPVDRYKQQKNITSRDSSDGSVPSEPRPTNDPECAKSLSASVTRLPPPPEEPHSHNGQTSQAGSQMGGTRMGTQQLNYKRSIAGDSTVSVHGPLPAAPVTVMQPVVMNGSMVYFNQNGMQQQPQQSMMHNESTQYQFQPQPQPQMHQNPMMMNQMGYYQQPQSFMPDPNAMRMSNNAGVLFTQQHQPQQQTNNVVYADPYAAGNQRTQSAMGNSMGGSFMGRPGAYQEQPRSRMMTSANHVRPGSSVSEAVYAPMSSTSTRYNTAVAPSEVSTFSTRIRRMQVPTKNSDVDKFLDDIFEPVLHGSVLDEGVYDGRSLVASIKGGAEGPIASSQPNQPQAPLATSQLQQPTMMAMPQQPIFMMMPQGAVNGNQMYMMAASSTMNNMANGNGTQNSLNGQQPMQFVPVQMMNQNAMPVQFMQQTEQNGAMMQTTCVSPLPVVTTQLKSQHLPELIPSQHQGEAPPPPEPSFPPPLPPHRANEQFQQNGFSSHRDQRPQQYSYSETHMNMTSSAAQQRAQSAAFSDQMIGMDIYSEAGTTAPPSRAVGRLPQVGRPHEEILLREAEGIERMRIASRQLPPPVDEVRFWTPQQRSYLVYEDGHVEDARNGQVNEYMMADNAQWRGPPDTDVHKYSIQHEQQQNHQQHQQHAEQLDQRAAARTPTVDYSFETQDRHSVAPLPQRNGTAQLQDINEDQASTVVLESDNQSDWFEESETMRPKGLERRARRPNMGSRAESRLTVADDGKVTGGRANQLRQGTGPVLTYASAPWKLTLRKEIFFRGEEITNVETLDVIYQQIMKDLLADELPFRIRDYEKEAIAEIFRAYQVPLAQAFNLSIIPSVVKQVIVDSARQWPLYFCRMFPVVEDRRSEFVAELLGVSESGIRLIARDYDSRDNPLSVLDHFDFDDLAQVDQPEPRMLRLVTRRGIQVRVHSEHAEQIKALIDQFVMGPMQGKDFVRAIANYMTQDSSLLKFTKSDIIELCAPPSGAVNEMADDGRSWAYGRLRDQEGYFPLEYVEAIGAAYSNQATPMHVPDPKHPEEQWISNALAQDNGTATINGEAVGKLTMMEYAMIYFRNAPVKLVPQRSGFEMIKKDDGTMKGTMKANDKKSKKEWTWKDIAEQVKFTKDPIHHALTRMDTNELDKLAVEAFLHIMRYMGDYPVKKGASVIDCVRELLMACYRHEPLRDEVYCQIIKQTTNNKSSRPDSPVRGWRLFSILTAYFDVSETLRPYLSKYLQDAANDTRRAYHGTAMVCLQNLRKTFRYGGRKYLLANKEIEAITLGKHLKRQLYHLPGGHKKVINTKSTTVVEEIIQDLCEELNIRSAFEQQEFAVCYILESDNAIKLLSNDDYVLDVSTELEQKGKDFFLLLKRTAWIHPLRQDNDLYTDVMFFQVVPDYLEGLVVVMRSVDSVSAQVMDDMATLAALLHYADEEADRRVPITARQVSELVPRTVERLRHVSPEQWAERVNKKVDAMPMSLRCRDARAQFLELLQKWSLFGSTFFYVANVTDERVAGECLMAINRNGIQFLHLVTHETLVEFRLSEVLSTHKVTATPQSGGPPVHFLDLKLGNLLQQKVITLQTEQGTEISRLLGQYIYVDSQNRGVIMGNTTETLQQF